ncbi:hypothetical protein [Mycobacterium sp.]|uniref:hypothetical protein n=1 Tax=Mycobacterium sp. TaxID=1785 RepID=UPI003F95EB6F
MLDTLGKVVATSEIGGGRLSPSRRSDIGLLTAFHQFADFVVLQLGQDRRRPQRTVRPFDRQ